jgi:hypothetical protein
MTAASSILRVQRHRRRERDGMVRLTIWKNETAVDNLLAHHGLLPPYGADNRDQRDAAWSEFIDRLLAADAEQHYS